MPVGIYIHIPFCLSKCGYCSFFSVPYEKNTLIRYLTYLKKEINQYQRRFHIEADTLYFGGGTPSLLSAEEIVSIIELFDLGSNAEITLEINPIQITETYLKLLSKTKINRLSIGVQSSLDKNLHFLGRAHKAANLTEIVTLCHTYGYKNISFDFIYGLPKVTLKEIKEDLLQLIRLNPAHISAYLLTVDDNVPFAQWKSKQPSDSVLAKQYTLIVTLLERLGYKQYEISNFAKRGYQSRHNLHYWNDDCYYGFGASAAGSLQTVRWQNPSDLRSWEALVDSNNPFSHHEQQTVAEQINNFILMQFRTNRGLHIPLFRKRFGRFFEYDYYPLLCKFIAQNLVEKRGNFVRLTSKSRFVSNAIIREFIR